MTDLIVSIGLMALMAVVCVATDEKGKTIKNIRQTIIYSAIVFLLVIFWCPMAGISIILALIIEEILIRIKITERWTKEHALEFLIVLAIIVLISSCIVIPGLYPAQYTDTRELVKENELLALGENVRFAGEPIFLATSVAQADYYDYSYAEGSGFRNGRISKFTPYIKESDQLNGTGKMIYYQRYRIFPFEGLWGRTSEFLYSLNRKVAQGDQEIEIYVPKGSVDKTIRI